MLLELLNLPLPDEQGVHAGTGITGPAQEWPELFFRVDISKANRPLADISFDARVSILISKVKEADSLTRERAVIRLLSLYESQLLRRQEADSFGQAVWAQGASDTGLPSGLTFLSSAAYRFPGTNAESVSRRFRKEVLERGLSAPLDGMFLANILTATKAREDKNRPFILSIEEALRLFDAIIAWRPRPSQMDLDHNRRDVGRLAGEVMVEAVFSVVGIRDLGLDRLEALFTTIESGMLPSLLVAIPDAIVSNTSRNKWGVDLICRAILSRKGNVSLHGISAVGRWRLYSRLRLLPKTPDLLRRAICTVIANADQPALHAALTLATRLVGDNEFGENEISSLVHALGRLQTDTAYESLNTRKSGVTAVSLVRAGCVRLAQALQSKGATDAAIDSWIGCAEFDPEPEVRYALEKPQHKEPRTESGTEENGPNELVSDTVTDELPPLRSGAIGDEKYPQ
jgi:hypothetical protein